LQRHIQSQARATARNQKRLRIKAMKKNTRFIKGVIATAAKEETVMPWTRGARRAAFIAKRNGSDQDRKSA